MPIRGVLTDWGHTLFDTGDSIRFLVERSSALGHPIDAPAAAALHARALARSRTAVELARGRDRDAATHRRCWLELWAELEAACPGVAAELYGFETSALGWQPYPDTGPFLEHLAALGVPVVVVSDVAFDLRPIFDHHRLCHLVLDVVLSGEHGTTKSEGRLFPLALERLGMPPRDVLMVGDNPANDGYAVEAGITTVLLPPVPSGSPRGLPRVLALLG